MPTTSKAAHCDIAPLTLVCTVMPVPASLLATSHTYAHMQNDSLQPPLLPHQQPTLAGVNPGAELVVKQT